MDPPLQSTTIITITSISTIVYQERNDKEDYDFKSSRALSEKISNCKQQLIH